MKNLFQKFGTQKSSNDSKKLNSGNRKIKPCDVCDVKGTYIGKEYAESWEKI